MEQGSEAAVIARVLGGEKGAFDELVRLWYPPLLRAAMALTGRRDAADDIVQETFVKAYTSLASFDTCREFRPWIYRIMVNTFRSEYRKMRREVLTDAVPEPANGGDPGPAGHLLEAERGEMTRRALDQLPEAWRTVLMLRGAEGMSYREIADATGVGIGTVMSRLHRGRKRLMDLLKGVLE